MKTMGAGMFKAKCLGLIDEVKMKHEAITITKKGEPMAMLVPIRNEPDPIFGFYKDKLVIKGDVESPIYSDEEWDAFFERSAEQLK